MIGSNQMSSFPRHGYHPVKTLMRHIYTCRCRLLGRRAAAFKSAGQRMWTSARQYVRVRTFARKFLLRPPAPWSKLRLMATVIASLRHGLGPSRLSARGFVQMRHGEVGKYAIIYFFKNGRRAFVLSAAGRPLVATRGCSTMSSV